MTGRAELRGSWRGPLGVVMWLGAINVAPMYVATLTAPLWGGAIGCVVSIAVLGVVFRWVARRTYVVGDQWRYRGVWFEYAAPAHAVTANALDDKNYEVRVGLDTRRVLGYAWYEAPGFPDGFGGEGHRFASGAGVVDADAAIASGDLHLVRRWRMPSAVEYVALLPVAVVWAVAFAAVR